MSPEFGSTCAIFPIDAETLRYLEFTGRPAEQIALVEAYAKEQGLWHDETSEDPTFSDLIELDLGEVVPSIAGPRRPQDRVALTDAQVEFRERLPEFLPEETDEDRRPGVPPTARAGGRRRRVLPVQRPAAATVPGNGDAASGSTTRRRPTTTRASPSACARSCR
jgi:aconitate hydratase